MYLLKHKHLLNGTHTEEHLYDLVQLKLKLMILKNIKSTLRRGRPQDKIDIKMIKRLGTEASCVRGDLTSLDELHQWKKCRDFFFFYVISFNLRCTR